MLARENNFSQHVSPNEWTRYVQTEKSVPTKPTYRGVPPFWCHLSLRGRLGSVWEPSLLSHSLSLSLSRSLFSHIHLATRAHLNGHLEARLRSSSLLQVAFSARPCSRLPVACMCVRCVCKTSCRASAIAPVAYVASSIVPSTWLAFSPFAHSNKVLTSLTSSVLSRSTFRGRGSASKRYGKLDFLPAGNSP